MSKVRGKPYEEIPPEARQRVADAQREYAEDHPARLLDERKYVTLNYDLERAGLLRTEATQFVARCSNDFAYVRDALASNEAVRRATDSLVEQHQKNDQRLDEIANYQGHGEKPSSHLLAERNLANLRHLQRMTKVLIHHEPGVVEDEETAKQSKEAALAVSAWVDRLYDKGLERRTAIRHIRNIFNAVYLRRQDPADSLAAADRALEVLAHIARIIDNRQRMRNPTLIRLNDTTQWWLKYGGRNLDSSEWDDPRYAPYRAVRTENLPDRELGRLMVALDTEHREAKKQRKRVNKITINVNSAGVRASPSQRRRRTAPKP